MTPGFSVCRMNRKTFRREWLSAAEALAGKAVWLVSESCLSKFLSRKGAVAAYRLAHSKVNSLRWKVTCRPYQKVDVIKKPVLTNIDWKRTNTDLGKEFGVSASTISNWRTAAGAIPARRGGLRPGAGRKRNRP